MLTTDAAKFESDVFAMQLLSKGSFVDTGCGPDLFQIDIYTLRLNHVAHNEYLSCSRRYTRDDFATEEEYLTGELERKARFDAWNKQVKDDLGITGATLIRQVCDEIYYAVKAYKIGRKAIPEEQAPSGDSDSYDALLPQEGENEQPV